MALSPVREQIVELLPRLRRFALTLSRNPADADDLVQLAVERALGRLETWDPDSRLDSWLFRIVQNLWIDEVRRRRGRGAQELEPDAGLEVAGVDGRHLTRVRQELAETLKAIFRLPEEQRAVLLLVVVEGLAYRDAAEVLGVPLGTVMSRLARARSNLETQVGRRTDP